MKTDQVPALVTLSAGAVYCVVGLSQHLSGFTFAKELLIVLIVFYAIGSIIKIILDKNFGDFGETEETEEPEQSENEESEEKEDIDFSEKDNSQES